MNQEQPTNSTIQLIQLLKSYFQDFRYDIPESKIKSEWTSRNKCGFLLGIAEYGERDHVDRLSTILKTKECSNEGEEDKMNRSNLLEAFINDMFEYYIESFHKSYSLATPCHTPTAYSTDDLQQNAEKTHCHLKKALVSRDEVCLFCWDFLENEAAHIIAQRNAAVENDERSVLRRVGLTDKHVIQNGLLLCIKCHSQFAKLKRYVDVVDDKLVVKVVEESNDKLIARGMKATRSDWSQILGKDRKITEDNDEMALYFKDNDEALQPNRAALLFHKTSCMIWKLAGGAEIDDEQCSLDDEDDFVKPSVHMQLKDIQKWQKSSATVINIKELSSKQQILHLLIWLFY